MTCGSETSDWTTWLYLSQMIFLSFFNNLDGVQRIASGNARRSLEIGEHVSNICLFILKLFHLRNFQRRNPAPSLKSKNCSFFSFLNCLWNHDLIFSYSPQFLQKQHRSLTKNLKTWSQRMSEEKTEDFDILLSIVLTRSTDDKAKPVWEKRCKQSFSRNLKIDLDGCHWQSFVKVKHKLCTYWKQSEKNLTASPTCNYKLSQKEKQVNTDRHLF